MPIVKNNAPKVSTSNKETTEPTIVKSTNKYGVKKNDFVPKELDNLLFVTPVSQFKAEGNKIDLTARYANTAKGESIRFLVEIGGEQFALFASRGADKKGGLMKEILDADMQNQKIEAQDIALYTLKGDDGQPYTIVGKLNGGAQTPDWD